MVNISKAGGGSASALLVQGLSLARAARTVVHTVLGKESDPDLTLRPSGPRTGDIKYLCADRASAEALADLHASAPGVMTMTEPGTVVRHNLAPAPLGSTATSTTGWTVSPGESIAFVTDEGQPAVVLSDPVGGGGGYAFTVVNSALPTVGQYVAVGADVFGTTALEAASMRLVIRTLTGSTQVDTVNVATPVPTGTWTRVVGSLPVATAGFDNVRALVWPSNSTTVGEQFRFRRVVVVFGDTAAQAEAACWSFFDGSTPPVSNLAYAWDGPANASASTETVGAVAGLTYVTTGDVLTEAVSDDGLAYTVSVGVTEVAT